MTEDNETTTLKVTRHHIPKRSAIHCFNFPAVLSVMEFVVQCDNRETFPKSKSIKTESQFQCNDRELSAFTGTLKNRVYVSH